MVSILNVIHFLHEHWVSIIIVAGIIVSIVTEITEFMKKSDEEKIAIAKMQIKESMLKLIADAEASYKFTKKSGAIKRSQVIKKIYETYPILYKVVDQKELVAYIDKCIDNSLITLREIISQNL